MNNSSLSAFDIFCGLAGCDLPDRPVLEQAISRRQLKPGEALFLVGEQKAFAFAVIEGIVKMVYETPGGDVWIKGFAGPGICFASLTALESQGVTSYSAYAVAASTIDQVSYPMLEQLASRHLPWQRALSNAFRFYGQRKEQREMELLTLAPEERYLRFLRTYPELAARIRQRDIASYVRVTPVALSRIRSRLKSKGLID
ncbi:MAG: Crp/Fnr family transcriptional regulator [Pseudomonadota bacterium]